MLAFCWFCLTCRPTVFSQSDHLAAGTPRASKDPKRHLLVAFDSRGFRPLKKHVEWIDPPEPVNVAIQAEGNVEEKAEEEPEEKPGEEPEEESEEEGWTKVKRRKH